jgi:hypothetical protein
MNGDTNNPLLPTLTADLLTRSGIHTDNLFSTMWKRLRFDTLLSQSGLKKRTGTPVTEVVYLLLLWVWLKANSIGMFSRESLLSFSAARKDALYDFLNREDVNWRQLQLLIARKVIRATDNSKLRAFVVDDSVKIRTGRKMPGVSSHFDHLNGRCVMGQQVLTLGIATEAQFMPLDSELFISQSKVQPLKNDFKDGRSIVAKRYRDGLENTKPQMVAQMVRRALRAGIDAQYFLSDSWFATKPILRFTEEESLIGVVRMKKNKMKYRLTADGAYHMLNATELHKHHVKGQWQKGRGLPYQFKSVEVELNLAQTKEDDDQWIKVKLLFSRGSDEEKQQAGKHDWAVFLSTDSHMDDEKILEVYALRWGIEVYFKEAKQNLGLLKEQSTHYSTYIASIHLTAIRFCMLLFAKHEESAQTLSDVRNDLAKNLRSQDFASQLWILFRAIIAGTFDELKTVYGEILGDILRQIDCKVKQFFEQVMQMDSFTLRQEAMPDSGYP